MKLCKLCTSSIPSRLVIGEKTHNIQNRRYCLKCVPFGTKSRKHTSNPNKKHNRSKWEVKWQKQERKRRKSVLVKMFGGKCIKCGYKKCIGALAFHHRNPSEKLFSIASRGLTNKWVDIVAEAKKCDLLCMNCHTEHHYGKVAEID